MSDNQKQVGTVPWMDLTVPDAESVRGFYEDVVGWTSTPVAMDGYDDWCMNAPQDGKTVAGICHAHGVNAEQPAQWMIYIVVEDLERSVARCRDLGGEVLTRREGGDGQGSFAVIRDPAGAVCALYELPSAG
jgi:predicted enzyme related to lactoylglutathione lyase